MSVIRSDPLEDELHEEHLELDEGNDYVIPPSFPEDMEFATENVSPLQANELFSFNGLFFIRFFRSQLRPKELTEVSIGGDTMEEVLGAIWQVAQDHVRREVIFKDAVPYWSDKVQPDVGDIGRFITLQNKAQRKGFSVGELNHRILTKWRGKVINLYIYPYSINVETNPQYQTVLRKLVSPEIPDRSGAHSTRDDSALANELREKHPDLEGHFSSWLLWANLINSSPAHERDLLRQADAPPVQLAKFFRWATVSEAARLQSVHRGMVVANTINEGWMRGITEIKGELAMASKLLQSAISKMEALELRGQYGSELCTAMESTTRPEETEISGILSERVTDSYDVDHC
ncbi:uncharacterized protein LOC129741550 [Uranotaenia lowii]|uniref:uncharacterized protein LOC129741550 n=1 Tax=Uranotaenia lowii TaxID=190385 RepID=UPI002479F376|nr:uncharacterized protein LOC129741550 [Uranotaenia lowii]